MSGRRGAAAYGEVLRQPGVRRVVVSGIAARLPLSMIGIGVLLIARRGSIGLANGGVVVSIFGLSVAASAALWGRVADRRGARGVLLGTGSAQCAALLALGPALRAGVVPAFGVAAVAGALAPPVSGVVRAQWAALPAELQATAQTMESVIVELVFLLGPLVFGLAVAVASPGAGLAAAAALVGLGSVSLALGRLRPPSTGHSGGGVFGVLRLPAARVLGGVFLLQVMSFACIEVSVTVAAAAAGRPALSGPLLALWAGGSALGGLAWGALHHRRSQRAQLTATTVGVAVLMAPIAITADPRFMLLAMLPAGLSIAPGSSVVGSLLGRAVPEAEHAEAYGLVFTGMTSLGAAIGYAGAAAAAASAGSRAAVAAGVLAATAGALVASVYRDRLPAG